MVHLWVEVTEIQMCILAPGVPKPRLFLFVGAGLRFVFFCFILHRLTMSAKPVTLCFSVSLCCKQASGTGNLNSTEGLLKSREER